MASCVCGIAPGNMSRRSCGQRDQLWRALQLIMNDRSLRPLTAVKPCMWVTVMECGSWRTSLWCIATRYLGLSWRCWNCTIVWCSLYTAWMLFQELSCILTSCIDTSVRFNAMWDYITMIIASQRIARCWACCKLILHFASSLPCLQSSFCHGSFIPIWGKWGIFLNASQLGIVAILHTCFYRCTDGLRPGPFLQPGCSCLVCCCHSVAMERSLQLAAQMRCSTLLLYGKMKAATAWR